MYSLLSLRSINIVAKFNTLDLNFRTLLKKSGITTNEKIIQSWIRHTDIIKKLEILNDVATASRIYTVLSSRLGTSTRRNMKATDGSIVVDGQFAVDQETSSTFYYAFESGKPCILKFSESEVSANDEINFYQSIENREYLVKIERKTLVLPELTCRYALKMKIYVHTLATVPHTDQLAVYYCEQMKRIVGALEAIHHSGMVHCDVKPNNIFMDDEGLCYLGDYDSGKKVDSPVEKITDSFVPNEFLVWRHDSGILIATSSLDFAMLSTTFHFLIRDKLINRTDDIRNWCRDSSLEISNFILSCLNIAEQDEQFRRGSAILLSNEEKRRAKVDESPSPPDRDPSSIPLLF